jgi:signal peptidase I
MTVEGLKNLWKKEFAQTAIMIVIILVVVFGLWFGSQLVLGTPYPALAVASGSMCKVQYMYCDGWSHPFERTLHIGDLIIVKAVNPKELNTAPYPDGDIIVFHKPLPTLDFPDELIVHRAIANTTRDGIVYFRTKGDGSSGGGDYWGNDYRGENYSWNGMVSEKLVVGKVVQRIPWIGHLALLMRNSYGMYIIIALIILIVIVEFVVPELRGKKPETKPEPAQETGEVQEPKAPS